MATANSGNQQGDQKQTSGKPEGQSDRSGVEQQQQFPDVTEELAKKEKQRQQEIQRQHEMKRQREMQRQQERQRQQLQQQQRPQQQQQEWGRQR